MGLSNLQKRIISGALYGIIFIVAIFFFRPLFFALIFVIAAMMLFEWYEMTKTNNKDLYFGLLIIPIPIISILYISNIDYSGWLLFSFFSIIWCMDSISMFVGKTFEGPKLAPVLSPNKTISGLIGGVVACCTLPLFFGLIPSYNLTNYIKISKIFLIFQFAIIALIAQMSDLFISYFKRKFNIKDTGNIIPGHGGVLDRFDSIILTAPIVALYLHYEIS